MSLADDANFVEDVRAFHEKMGVAYDGDPRPLPGSPLNRGAVELLKAARQQLQRASDGSHLPFRVGFLLEEVIEYIDAVRAGDLAGQLDALVDLVYIAIGTAYTQGLPFDAAWVRVHAANLRKERGTATTSKRKSPFDVVKPAGWAPPDLTDLVRPRSVRTAATVAAVERLRAELGLGPHAEIVERDAK
jgi:predicted HAD superfamily Cof-like phosphohydrolase